MSANRITPSGTSKPFPPSPTVTGGGSRPLPAMLGRNDVPNGRWSVSDCRPVRGEPRTDIDGREMFAPTDDTELSRVIRGHEMIHAKVSPTHSELVKWLERGIASQPALIAVEELRVNLLAQHAGFDAKKYLADGSEQLTGERCAQSGDWAGAVIMAIATAQTAGYNKFITGVRRHNKEWANELKLIVNKATRELKKALKRGRLASTDRVVDSELAPFGFAFTEQVAEWLDRIASFPPEPKPTGTERGRSRGGESDGMGTPSDERGVIDNPESDTPEGAPPDRKGEPRAKTVDLSPTGTYGRIPEWYPLKVERLPMPRYSKGNIGKKRIATNTGRRPRRLHRMMTDPARRVFDRTVRGSGGVVLIDGSGSMSLTLEQVAQMTEAAHGCTVAVYSHRTYGDNSNLWVLAERGRMVETLDGADYGYGNGVDFPALKWASQQRENSRVPFVWVCDGYVTGKGDRNHPMLMNQVTEFCLRNNVLIASDADEAVAMLRKLDKGVRVTQTFPHILREAYYQANRVRLP